MDIHFCIQRFPHYYVFKKFPKIDFMSTNKLPKPYSFATSLICCFKDTMKKDLKLLFFSELYFNHLVNSVTLVYQNKFSVRAALFERKSLLTRVVKKNRVWKVASWICIWMKCKILIILTFLYPAREVRSVNWCNLDVIEYNLTSESRRVVE